MSFPMSFVGNPVLKGDIPMAQTYEKGNLPKIREMNIALFNRSQFTIYQLYDQRSFTDFSNF